MLYSEPGTEAEEPLEGGQDPKPLLRAEPQARFDFDSAEHLTNEELRQAPIFLRKNCAFLINVDYLPGMPKSAFEPCIPTRGMKVSERPEWILEIRHDGYRMGLGHHFQGGAGHTGFGNSDDFLLSRVRSVYRVKCSCASGDGAEGGAAAAAGRSARGVEAGSSRPE